MKDLLLFITTVAFAQGQTYLRADGLTDTYSFIGSVLGRGAQEVPDCIHNVTHIRQEHDNELNKQVFLFFVHLHLDNDRCINLDRQRVEIKPTNSPLVDSLKGFHGETVTLSWNFKLDQAFQPSSGFTHIHQLLASTGAGGNTRWGVMTLTARHKANGDILELIHINAKNVRVKLISIKLAPLRGTWVHVNENVTFNPAPFGKYSVIIQTVGTGETLLNYTNNRIDMWKNDATVVRPKWGIYRSLLNKERLRDEVARFNDFCIGKGSSICS